MPPPRPGGSAEVQLANSSAGTCVGPGANCPLPQRAIPNSGAPGELVAPEATRRSEWKSPSTRAQRFVAVQEPRVDCMIKQAGNAQLDKPLVRPDSWALRPGSRTSKMCCQAAMGVLPEPERGNERRRPGARGAEMLAASVFSDMLIGTSVSPLSPVGDLTLPGAQD